MNQFVLRRVGLLLMGLVAAIALVACGSDSSSSTTSEEGGSSTDWSALLEESKEMVPSKFEGPTEPAPAKPGVKVGIISCGQTLQGCVEQSKGAEEAAEIAGWVPRVFDGKLEPTPQNAQILNALNWGAEVILLVAVDPNAVQTGLSAAKKNGALIASTSNGLSEPNETVEPPAGNIWPAFDVSADFKLAGEKQAQWIVADSEGTANVVVYGGKEFPSVVAQQPGVLKVLEECEGCTVSDVQYFTASQIATSLGQEVVSYLRTHPEVDYVFSPYDPASTGMVPAIQNAGLGDKVKLVSFLGNEANLQYIEEENVQAASGALAQKYMGFGAIDQAIRSLNKQPLFKPLGENTPTQLLTKEDLPPELVWEPPFDYVQKYTELWTGG
jgi:ribose transport system substrate-binding protein